MKIETVTYYVATDGERFTDEEECRKYEADGCVEFEPIPDFGDHVPISEKGSDWLLDGDGSCYFATKTHYAPRLVAGDDKPEWATHYMYFGK